MSEQVPNCPQPESPWGHVVQAVSTKIICRWGARANPLSTILRDQCGDYWVRKGNEKIRQFDTLEQAFNYGDTTP